VSTGRTRNLVLLAVFALGVAAVVTQLALLREMLSVFTGNELVLGIVLGNWLLLTGLGTALGRTAHRLRQPLRVLTGMQVLIAILPLLQVVALPRSASVPGLAFTAAVSSASSAVRRPDSLVLSTRAVRVMALGDAPSLMASAPSMPAYCRSSSRCGFLGVCSGPCGISNSFCSSNSCIGFSLLSISNVLLSVYNFLSTLYTSLGGRFFFFFKVLVAVNSLTQVQVSFSKCKLCFLTCTGVGWEVLDTL
jgi:hypothetical protein